MKTAFLALALWSTLFAAASEGAPLESQFRRDVEVFVRARATQPIQEASVAKTVEDLVSGVKSSFPGVLKEDAATDTPTEEVLRRAYSDLERVGAGAPRPVLVSFYTELWKAKRLGPQQKIIFQRLMAAIVAAAEKQKKANQSPEPTSGLRPAVAHL